MGYEFKRILYPVRKNAAESAVLLKLRRFLDASEPRLAAFLVTLWQAQGNAITYKELREAILSGAITTEYIEQWQQDYARFVVKHLLPEWEQAMQTAVQELEQKYPEWYFNPTAEGVRSWTDSRAAEFVTSSTSTQIEALRAIVRRAAVLEDMSVDQLARAIRPMVGLYYQQGVANMNYLENLLKSGTKPKRAIELSTRYAARQHRYRAMMIARTELCYAYNQGAYQGAKQAQEAGYLGEAVKVWVTADDERVCDICGGLDGMEIGMDDDFDFGTKLSLQRYPTIRRVPPAHPHCRCGFLIKEIAPPVQR